MHWTCCGITRPLWGGHPLEFVLRLQTAPHSGCLTPPLPPVLPEGIKSQLPVPSSGQAGDLGQCRRRLRVWTRLLDHAHSALEGNGPHIRPAAQEALLLTALCPLAGPERFGDRLAQPCVEWRESASTEGLLPPAVPLGLSVCAYTFLMSKAETWGISLKCGDPLLRGVRCLTGSSLFKRTTHVSNGCLPGWSGEGLCRSRY